MASSKKQSKPSKKEEQAGPPADDSAPASAAGQKADFPVVGIGASAGGLEALGEFFTHMPPDNGMAFILILHLAPDHKSMISNILQKYTDMPVAEIESGMEIEPNAVYVIAPNAYVGIINGTLQLLEPNTPRAQRAPIDYFFRSLADDRAERAIAIVLSGTGSNGSIGLRAVKGVGGMVMVQHPETAQYQGMPHRAIATGLADYIASPAEMPSHLIEYVTSFTAKIRHRSPSDLPQNRDALQRIFILLRDQTGHDFSQYKLSTVMRRLNRRMALHQFETLSEYAQYLSVESRKEKEMEALFKEMLIGVTNFFRDPEAFVTLKEKVLPHLFNHRPAHQPLRVWVPGCSTGEEAYSIAIVIKEYLIEQQMNVKVQVFASDIDHVAIDVARQGIYPDGIAVDVSSQRMNRFFTPDDDSYRINSDIREMVVFAEQSVIKDPPFSNMDMISCRNLLIYLQADLQQRVLSLFHYSLRENGILFLGTSETRVENQELQYAAFDQKWKFFKRVGKTSFGRHPYGSGFLVSDPRIPVSATAVARPYYPYKEDEKQKSPRKHTEAILLAQYAPPAVVVDGQGSIIFIHGHTAPYLSPPSGEQPFNLLDMASEGLRLQLHAGIHKALLQNEVVVYERLRLNLATEVRYLTLTILPLVFENKDQPEWVLVIFEKAAPPPAQVEGDASGSSSADSVRIAELEQELVVTKDYLQTTVEELETANEDVRAANEELQAANEELQSMNEELQTSQEELRSSNEELMTMNTDYQNEIHQLREGHDDIKNLLINSQVPMLFVDMDLRIKHFTPSVTDIVRLIPSDVGRPLDDLTIKLDYNNLVDDAEQVLKNLIPRELETQGLAGGWYSIRLLPYRTTKNVIAGVVITFSDISALKELAQQQLTVDYLNSIVATVRQPLLVLTAKLRVVSANRAFYTTFAVKPAETEGKLIYQLGNNQWDIPALRQLLEQIIPRENSFDDFRVEHDFPGIGRRVMLLNARELRQKEGEPPLILLAIEDFTERA